MKNLIALAHVLEMATTSNMTVVVEPKQDDTFPYKASVKMPIFEELYKYADDFSTGKQRRTARRKAERDKKKGKV